MHEHYGEACDDALRLDPSEVLSYFGQIELTFDNIVLVVISCDNLTRLSLLFFFLILALLQLFVCELGPHTPSADFYDDFINGSRLLDLQVEYGGARLVANLERVSEAF